MIIVNCKLLYGVREGGSKEGAFYTMLVVGNATKSLFYRHWGRISFTGFCDSKTHHGFKDSETTFTSLQRAKEKRGYEFEPPHTTTFLLNETNLSDVRESILEWVEESTNINNHEDLRSGINNVLSALDDSSATVKVESVVLDELPVDMKEGIEEMEKAKEEEKKSKYYDNPMFGAFS